MVMNLSISGNRKLSLWNFISFEPLYVLIPNIFIIRPIRIILNYYVKPAKFLVIILPRNIWNKVRRNETICCLIGFGIGVGCCILYRLISNFLAPSSSSTTSISNNTLSSLSNNIRDAKTLQMGQEHSSLSSNGNEITVTYTKRPRSSTTLKRTTPDRTNTRIANDKCHYQQYSNDSDREPLLGLPIDKHHISIPNKNYPTSQLSDEMTWSEISSSIGTSVLLQESYHSNSLTGDSGVDCHEISTIKSFRNQQHNHDITPITNPIIDNDYDENESLINHSTNGTNTLLYSESRKYDSDTALSRGVILQDTQTVTESHVQCCMSTEKGLERALEQTSRFYSDLEHIATDLNTLSKKYSQSQTSVSPSISKYYNQPIHNTIDALDWDWNDFHSSPLVHSPKNRQKKQHQQYTSSSLSRLNNHKYKVRRRLTNIHKQTDYNESDLEIRTSISYDCTSSPLRRKPSSVYFDSTDNTSGDENFGDETLQIPSPSSVLTSSRTTERFSISK
ncbi:unnamed protein product [Rotaria sp. Silwood1]|nr:unnamed protein product [Rotaria sp. Silwood1]CAF3381913.1 unnamed protein product [Rotaria sp. Silwood1]